MKKSFHIYSLLIAFLLTIGTSNRAVAAEPVTDDFSGYTTTTSGTTLGDNWVIIGNDGSGAAFGSNSYVHYNEYGEHYVAGNSANNYTKGVWLVLKKQVAGTVTFKATNGNANSTFTIYASKATKSGDSYEVTGDASSYSVPSRTSNAKTYTFEAGDAPTYVAFCLVGTSKNPKLQSVTYTEYEATSTPTLAVTDFAAGSTYDFGGVAVPAGTEQSFTLNNFGQSALTVSSIAVSGGFTLTEGADISTIGAGGTATVKVATPAADATGALTITSNDPTNPAYTINLKSIYKVPAPVMGVDLTEVVFGKVTANATKDVTVSNTGDAPLTVSISSSAADFTVSPASLDVAAGESGTFTITYNYDATAYGLHSSTVTVTPNVGEAHTIAVSAKVQDPSVWTEDFEGNALPAGWTAEDHWTFADGTAQAAYAYGTTDYLTTPALEVAAGEELVFQYKATSNYVSIKIQMAKDGGSFADYKTISGLNTMSEFDTYTISGLAAGTYKFRFANDDYVLDNFEGYKLSQNAPELALTPAEDATFGKVTEQVSKIYTVANNGTGKMTVNIASSTADFTVTPAQLTDIENGSPQTFTVVFNHSIENLGEKTATITVTPTYNELAAVSFTASATAKNPNVWEEDFEDGIPASWTNDGWTIGRKWNEENSVNHANAAYNSGYLVTPRLKAVAGEELTFEYYANYSTLVVEWANDIDAATWNSVGTYTDDQTVTFTAPADGTYYLRFSGSGSYLDNFEGFQLDLLAADAIITASTLPAAGNQYAPYKAQVTMENKGTEAQTVVARLFFKGEAVDTQEAALAVGGKAVVDLQFTPDEAVENAPVKIEVTLKDVAAFAAKSVEGTVTVSEVETISETAANTFESGKEYTAVRIDYTPQDGWNTIALPFSPTNDQMTQLFGEGWKAYYFDKYENNTVKFVSATYFRAGIPFLVYVENARTESAPVLFNITIAAAEAGADEAGSAAFRATYAPMAAGTLTDKYTVSADCRAEKADAATTLSGLRGYIELPEATATPTIVVDGQAIATTIGTMHRQQASEGTSYDLQGRQVVSPQKGLYIVNGKKLIRK